MVAAAREARRLTEENVVPPALMLRQLAFVMRASRALYAAAELNIADFLASGPLTTAELAAAVAADAATLRRLMRMASSRKRLATVSASTRPVS
jgi:Dimerisation domain